MLQHYVRKQLGKHFTGQKNISFSNEIPDLKRIASNISQMDTIGIYLHIPFCNQICPYCPYNKEIFKPEKAKKYVRAVKKEVDSYASLLENQAISSFYIGGGTPTTLLDYGLDELIAHIYDKLNMDCKVHMESHPNHLSTDSLEKLKKIGVNYLSIGVEALQDCHLKAIHRTYDTESVKKTLQQAVAAGFECVNIDIIFDLPNQSRAELYQTAHDIVGIGVDQIATYPLFNFPYTRLGKEFTRKRNPVSTMFRRRRLLKIFEEVFYNEGYERSSVWAFTKKGIDKYCSVTVPSYIGLGASGGSYLNDIFYVNTFNVGAYNEAMDTGRAPIALSIDLNPEMQMSGWLYWRLYETKFNKDSFNKRFGEDFDQKYGKYFRWMSRLGYVKTSNGSISLTDKGTYWIHAFEDFFSINYINKLWGTSIKDPWPEKVIL